MSHARTLHADTDPTTESNPVPVQYVTVSVVAGQLTVTPPYIEVPQDSATEIVWTLDQPTIDQKIRFDTPAITFFGENAPITWLEPRPNVRTALWVNNKPQHSYSYRVHLLQQTEHGIVPITDDPIIHNDPPSAP